MISKFCQAKKSGFTLMEVITIIMIVSVMSTVVMQSGGSFYATQQAYASASMLVSDIRMARYRAIEHQCYIKLQFEPFGDGWTLQEMYDDDLDEAVTGEFTGTNKGWRSIIGVERRELSSSVTMAYDPVSPPVVYFRPDGLLSEADSFDAAPIGTFHVSFLFEDSEDYEGAKVTISPSGAIESTAYYKDDY